MCYSCIYFTGHYCYYTNIDVLYRVYSNKLQWIAEYCILLPHDFNNMLKRFGLAA